jgi:hypothetical protein
MVCPPGFKYLNTAGVEQCVYNSDNQYTLHLQEFPTNSNPGTFDDEKRRFTDDYSALMTRIHTTTTPDVVQAYETTSSQSDMLDQMDKTIAALKPRRPPTQPHEDVSVAANQVIKDQTSTDLLVIQIALFTVFLSILAFMFMSPVYAQYVVVLLLASGVALGYYLWSI